MQKGLSAGEKILIEEFSKMTQKPSERYPVNLKLTGLVRKVMEESVTKTVGE